MITYEQKNITIPTRSHGPKSIRADVSPCGLAFHHTCYGAYNGPDWTVTHVASGLVLGNEADHFTSPGQCKSFIARVADLTDWTAEQPVLTDEMKARINLAAQECQKLSITYL